MRAKHTTEADVTSRTAKKRALAIIEKMTKELVDLNAGEFAALELDPDIRLQVQVTKDLKDHTAKRRQLRFLCRFIAESDYLAVQRALALLKSGKRADADHFQSLEAYREQLIAGDAATVDEIVKLLPNSDPKQLRKLQLLAQKELQLGKKVTEARVLFRYLRLAAEKSS